MGVAYLLVTMVKSYAFRFWLLAENVPSIVIFFKLNEIVMLMAGLRLMAIWLLAYHLYHYAQREINIAKENAHIAIIAKDAQLNSLSAKLNPHSFSGISFRIVCYKGIFLYSKILF